MTRTFRFRVREGHQLYEWGENGTETHGAGYEFVLSEKDAATLLRNRGSRNVFDLVEVVANVEAVEPSAEQPASD
jgi:hypothetical protein